MSQTLAKFKKFDGTVCVCVFVLFYALVLKADPAHDLAEEVEVLGRFASFGVGLFLAPLRVSGQFLLKETGVDPCRGEKEKRKEKGVTGQKKRMRSQQESCRGLALSGLRGSKLIWKVCALS